MQPVMVPYFSRLLILGKRNLRSWKILDDNIFLGYRTTLSAVLLHIRNAYLLLQWEIHYLSIFLNPNQIVT